MHEYVEKEMDDKLDANFELHSSLLGHAQGANVIRKLAEENLFRWHRNYKAANGK